MVANPKRSRLVALTEALATIRAATQACAPSDLAVETAIGCVLAGDVAAFADNPATTIAAWDGWAVSAAETMGASSYAPMPLPELPVLVAVGDALPPGTDAVLRYDAVTVLGPFAECGEEAVPGSGTVAAGSDAVSGQILAPAGQRLSPFAAAALSACGETRLAVRRPKILLLSLERDGGFGSEDSCLDASGPLIAACCGEAAIVRRTSARDFHALSDALEGLDADAAFIIGGTGEGENDAVLAALAAVGTALFHGVALAPGESAGFGLAGERPVLALPGRPDAALSVFLVLGRPLLEALTGASPEPPSISLPLTLTRKLVSAPGMATLRFVRADGKGCEPMPDPLPLGRLGEIEGYVLSEAGSEGWPEGAPVPVHPLPRLW